MVINISVHYNGGFLPDIILLTHGYYIGAPGSILRCVLFFLRRSRCVLFFLRRSRCVLFFLTGGCSEGLGAFWFFFKHSCAIV